MYEIFHALLKERGVRVSDVCKATGIANSTMTAWKQNKSVPNTKTLQRIADYFGVDLAVFIGGQPAEKKEYYDNETLEFAEKLFENKELNMLMKDAMDADREDIATAHNMLLALKRKERHYD